MTQSERIGTKLNTLPPVKPVEAPQNIAVSDPKISAALARFRSLGQADKAISDAVKAEEDDE